MKKRSFWLYRKEDKIDSKTENMTEQLNEQDELNNKNEVQKEGDGQSKSEEQQESKNEQEESISQESKVDNLGTTNNSKGENQIKSNAFKEMLKDWNISDQPNHIEANEQSQGDMDNRRVSDGFALKNESVQISDAIISNLIDNFINKKFQTRDSQLNARQDSTIKDYGFEKWDTMQLVKHKVTKEYGKMLKDKYGYKKDEKKSETIPLSFYFDLSGSMKEYSHILSIIALKILQKQIKLLIGYNDNIVYQIDGIPTDKKITVKEFQDILNGNLKDKMIKNEKLEYQVINQQLDEYLLEHNAEKVTLFTDFDPLGAIKKISEKAELYWFCFEKHKIQPFNFKGRFFCINKLEDIIFYMKNIDRPYIKKDEEELCRED